MADVVAAAMDDVRRERERRGKEVVAIRNSVVVAMIATRMIKEDEERDRDLEKSCARDDREEEDAVRVAEVGIGDLVVATAADADPSVDEDRIAGVGDTDGHLKKRERERDDSNPVAVEGVDEISDPSAAVAAVADDLAAAVDVVADRSSAADDSHSPNQPNQVAVLSARSTPSTVQAAVSPFLHSRVHRSIPIQPFQQR